MRVRSLILPSLIVIATACSRAAPAVETAPAPAPAPAAAAPAPAPAASTTATADPVGRWAVNLDAQGQMIELVMEIQKNADGSLGGSASSNMFPPTTFSKVTLAGNRLYLETPTPMGTVAVFDLAIDGDNITGEWSTSGMGSRVTGRRLR